VLRSVEAWVSTYQKMVQQMQLYLKNYHSNEKMAFEFDWRKVGKGDESASSNITCGFYCELGGDRIGLFAVNDMLYIYLNDRTCQVDDECRVSYLQKGNSRELKLSFGPENYDVIYINLRNAVSTQYHSEDEEDVDFGLWLYNVLSSSQRRQIFITSWGQTN
jgi:hypothetical protein